MSAQHSTRAGSDWCHTLNNSGPLQEFEPWQSFVFKLSALVMCVVMQVNRPKHPNNSRHPSKSDQGSPAGGFLPVLYDSGSPATKRYLDRFSA